MFIISNHRAKLDIDLISAKAVNNLRTILGDRS